MNSFIILFENINLDDLSEAGGKNASLGEMIQKLKPMGINIPLGFAVTASAYRHFLSVNHLEDQLKQLLDKVEKQDLGNLPEIAHKCRELVSTATMPEDLQNSIRQAYTSFSLQDKRKFRWLMVEIPSNVVLAERFAQLFDGFSIGSNDLTQLTLGLDRDSEIVSHLFEETNETVTTMIAQAIKAAKKDGNKNRIMWPGAQ